MINNTSDVDSSEKTPFLKKKDSSDSETIPNPSKNNNDLTIYICGLTFFAGLGGFLFGYDTGVISGALLPLKRLFQLDTIWRELIVSVTVGAAIFGAITGGWFNDKFGRKPLLITSSIVFSCGAVIMAIAKNKETLLCGRTVVGLAIGYASTTVPMYIAEAAPASIRGRLITFYQLSITFGQCCASIIDGIFSGDKAHGWRFMLGFGGIPAVIMLFGMLFMPESPRYLAKKGKIAEAEAVLQRLRSRADVQEELNGIITSVQKDASEETGGAFTTLIRVLKTSYTRRALLVGCGLQAIQQLCGINTVMYYSATIISMAGVQDERKAIWLSAVVATCNFVFTFGALYLVEKVGRVRLTLGSLFGVVVALSLLSTTFFLLKAESPKTMVKYSTDSSCSKYTSCYHCVTNDKCGFCYAHPSENKFINGSCLNYVHDVKPVLCNATSYLWSKSSCPTNYAWLAVLSMVIYLFAFAQGMGPMPWAMNAEIYPLWARGTGTSCSTATNWFFNLLISITFLNLIDLVSRAGAFLVYASFAVIGWIFLFLLLPETKGEALEDIEELFKSNLIIRFADKRSQKHQSLTSE